MIHFNLLRYYQVNLNNKMHKILFYGKSIYRVSLVSRYIKNSIEIYLQTTRILCHLNRTWDFDIFYSMKNCYLVRLTDSDYAYDVVEGDIWIYFLLKKMEQYHDLARSNQIYHCQQYMLNLW